MFKGTYAGNLEEIDFIKLFNSSKENFRYFLDNFPSFNNLWMVRVTTKQLSKLNGKKVFTRSDCYLANFSINMKTILLEYNYLLTEDILEQYHINFIKVPYSGISIKMASSNNYQILKVGPNSFKELFGSFELGAGASLFCQKQNELPKNSDLITGWHTSIDKMINFFYDYTNGYSDFYLNQDICTKIKQFSCLKIKEMIEKSQELKEKIFNGKWLYEEPYTAYYFYHGKNITKLVTFPFSVTTGSGRSKGDYTIVLKPQ